MQRSTILPLIKECAKLKLDGIKLELLADLFLNPHQACIKQNAQPPCDHKIIEKSETVLSDFNTFYKSLETFAEKLKPHTSDIHYQKAFAEFTKVKLDAIGKLINIKTMLADKYMFARERYQSHEKRKELIGKAFTLTNEAIAMCEHTGIVILESSKKEMLSVADHIARLHYEYQLNDTVSQLLFEARSLKNKENAYNKYQEALQLTTDFERRFYILHEQGTEIVRNIEKISNIIASKNLQHLEQFRKTIKKGTQCFIKAAEIKMANISSSGAMNRNAEGIFIDLYGISRELIRLCQETWLTNNIEIKRQLLLDAETYIECADKLSANMNISSADAAQITKSFKLEMDKLNSSKEANKREKKKKQKANRKNNLRMQKYLAAFDDLVKTFETENQQSRILNKKKKKKAVKNIDSENNHHSSSDEEETQSQNSATETNQANFYFTIDIVEQKKLLVEAKINKDTIKQIQINTCIAEYYAIKSSQDYKINEMDFVYSCIDNIELATDYCDDANTILTKISQEAAAFDLTKLNQCFNIALDHIKQLHAKAVYKFDKIKIASDKQHNDVKTNIIECEGLEAWFQNKDQAEISLEAKDYAKVIKYHNKLTSINKKLNPMTQAEGHQQKPKILFNEFPTLLSPLLSTTEISTTNSEPLQENVTLENEILNILTELANIDDENSFDQFKIKLHLLIRDDIQLARQQKREYLYPIFEPRQLINYFCYHCIHGQLHALFNVAATEYTWLPYLLPIPISAWPFNNEVLEEIQQELEKQDLYNKISTTQPKNLSIILGHFIMTILARTEALCLPLAELIDHIGKFLPMDPFLAKSIEIYQNYYLQTNHISNKVQKVSNASIFASSTNITLPEKIQTPSPRPGGN